MITLDRPAAPSSGSSSCPPAASGWCAATSRPCSGWPTPPPRSPTSSSTPARSPSPSASRPPTPTPAPRSARSASPSTTCSTTSRAPSSHGTTASSGCASSSPTPRTSCGRRWPPSAGMPSCPVASASRCPRRSPTRCRASSPRRCACRDSSRTSCCWPGSTPAARSTASRSTCPCSRWMPSATPTPPRPTTAGSSTSPTQPVEVTGDHARLHQVVANLLANARTHTPAGTRVVMSVKPDDQWVRLSVSDDGPGVPEALQRNVFQRFTRGDDSRNRASGSSGLGLSIVDAVAKSHGGNVELRLHGPATRPSPCSAARLSGRPPARWRRRPERSAENSCQLPGFPCTRAALSAREVGPSGRSSSQGTGPGSSPRLRSGTGTAQGRTRP